MGDNDLAKYNQSLRNAELIGEVAGEVSKILDRYLQQSNQYFALGLTENDLERIYEKIYPSVFDDLLAFAHRDPAAGRNPQRVLSSYSTFRAVMHYRVANVIANYETIDSELRVDLAKLICDNAKTQTGIDIEPRANIGRRFVIDHGEGVVIGETCEIGDDCYILQGVILGALGLADNMPGKRHPTLGNRVQVGAFARIIGPITIGDGVFVSPHCVIDQDIPPRVCVIIVNQLQLRSTVSAQRIEIYGIVPKNDKEIWIYGYNFPAELTVSLADEHYKDIEQVKISVVSASGSRIRIKFEVSDDSVGSQELKNRLDRARLRVKTAEDTFVITESPGLRKAVTSLVRTQT